MTLTPAEIRAGLDHPVIDADGHGIEFLPWFRELLRDEGGAAAVDGWNLIEHGASLARDLDPDTSIAAGGTSQVNMSLDGASPGDFVQASFSVATTAVLFLATVGAADTVTVVAWNRATSAIDLAGGTLRVRVTKA